MRYGIAQCPNPFGVITGETTMLEKALQYLLSLIAKGAEYPDAEFMACEAFKVNADELRALYDSME